MAVKFTLVLETYQVIYLKESQFFLISTESLIDANVNTYPLYDTCLCEHISVVTQRCIQKIIQEEDCSIKALQQEGKKCSANLSKG